MSGSQTLPRPASCVSWETFADDAATASVPVATITHVSSAKDLSFSSERLKFKEPLRDAANNNVCMYDCCSISDVSCVWIDLFMVVF